MTDQEVMNMTKMMERYARALESGIGTNSISECMDIMCAGLNSVVIDDTEVTEEFINLCEAFEHVALISKFNHQLEISNKIENLKNGNTSEK